MFKYYNHLGFHSPYYFSRDNNFIIKNNFNEILKHYNKEKVLDLGAVLQVLNYNFMLGDRTIIKGVNKSPWMAKPNLENSKWCYSNEIATNLDKYSGLKFREEEVAQTFFELLYQELIEYIGNSKKIGVLLSGGMDSRIVAGLLAHHIKKENLTIEVVALTWGNENSRDVIYAKQIAEFLNWDWKHYKVDSNDLMNNIEFSSKYGSEYSPIHLHAMPQIRKQTQLDCILAGSFGDSIGRGEYSGVKAANLKPFKENLANKAYLLTHSTFKNYKRNVHSDIENYHRLFPQKQAHLQIEQDYQIHYMRRMLNSCMNVINEKIPVYQMFTNPKTVGFIWSLPPTIRTDNIYKIILSYLEPELKNIPWARTGLIYGETKGLPDSYAKKHHNYASYISRDILCEIKDKIYSSDIITKKIINEKSLKSIFKLISILPKENNIYYGERIIWLASLAVTIKKYDIYIPNQISKLETVNNINGFVYSPLFILLRNLKRVI